MNRELREINRRQSSSFNIANLTQPCRGGYHLYSSLQLFASQGVATRRTAAAVGGTGGKPQAESVLHDTNEINRFSVPLTRQRVVGSPHPYKVNSHKRLHKPRADDIRPPHGSTYVSRCVFCGQRSSPLRCTAYNSHAIPVFRAVYTKNPTQGTPRAGFAVLLNTFAECAVIRILPWLCCRRELSAFADIRRHR